MKSKNKNRKKISNSRIRFRLFIFFLLFAIFAGILGYNCGSNILKLMQLHAEKRELEKQIVYLTDEKENLEADVERLSDSTYIARYAREKYLYSKDNEIIIRLDGDNN